MEEKKILFALSRFGIGGIQTFVIQLANHLSLNYPNLKISIYCYYPELSDTANNDQLSKEIKIFTLTKNKHLLLVLNKVSSFTRFLIPSFNLKAEVIKWDYLRTVLLEKIDLVHSNIYITDQLALASKKKYNLPFITTAHGSYDEVVLSEKKVKLMKGISSFCDMYVYMADKNLKNFRKLALPLDRNLFIPYGFESDFEHCNCNIITSDSVVKFCMTARGVAEKGWIQLESAVDILKSKSLKFELHVAGDGELIRDLFANRENEDIFDHGPLKNPMELINRCDVGLLPTFLPEETMPFSIIEYLYLSKPVIASDIGSIKWMLEIDGQVGGEIVQLENYGKVSPEVLAFKMEQYILDKHKLERDTKIATMAFDKFSISACGKSYVDLYKTVLDK